MTKTQIALRTALIAGASLIAHDRARPTPRRP